MASGFDKNRDYVEEIRLSRERKEQQDLLNIAETKKLQATNKKRETQFKAVHGVLLAWLSLFVYVYSSGPLLQSLDI